MAAPKRSQKWVSTAPGKPERPRASVPGEASWITMPPGVRASVHNTNTRACPCFTSPRVSPTSFVPRSRRTT